MPGDGIGAGRPPGGPGVRTATRSAAGSAGCDQLAESGRDRDTDQGEGQVDPELIEAVGDQQGPDHQRAERQRGARRQDETHVGQDHDRGGGQADGGVAGRGRIGPEERGDDGGEEDDGRREPPQWPDTRPVGEEGVDRGQLQGQRQVQDRKAALVGRPRHVVQDGQDGGAGEKRAGRQSISLSPKHVAYNLVIDPYPRTPL